MAKQKKEKAEKKQDLNIRTSDPIFKVFLRAMAFEADGTLGSSRQSLIEWFRRREIEMYSRNRDNLDENKRLSKAEKNTKSFITTFFNKDTFTPNFLATILRKFQIFTEQNLASETLIIGKPKIIPFDNWHKFAMAFTGVFEEFMRIESGLLEDYDNKFTMEPRREDKISIYAYYFVRLMYGSAIRLGAVFYKQIDQTVVGACEARLLHRLPEIMPDKRFEKLQVFFDYQLNAPRALFIDLKKIYSRNRNAVLVARNRNQDIADVILLLPMKEAFCPKLADGSLFHEELPVELICEEDDLSDFHHIFLDFNSTPTDIPLKDFQKYIKATFFSITGSVLDKNGMICLLNDTTQKRDFIMRMGFYPVAFTKRSNDLLDSLSNPFKLEYQLFGKHLNEFDSDVI